MTINAYIVIAFIIFWGALGAWMLKHENHNEPPLSAVDADDVFVVSVDGKEIKITTENFIDWLELQTEMSPTK